MSITPVRIPVDMTDADLADIDSLVVEMRQSDREAMEHDPDFEKWLEKVATKVD